MRLNRYLAQCGVASRRKCEAIIQSGRVQVNDVTIDSLGTLVDEFSDVVSIDGVRILPADKKIYVLLNKPEGYLSTVSDDRGRKTVCDLIPASLKLFPVGRLDLDTEGVLLLTNDGELAYRLTHPKFYIEKEYLACLDKPIAAKDLLRLEGGILLEEGMTAPCQARVLKNNRYVVIVLHEGRKRQVKRMFASLNYQVLHLKRTKMAGLTVKGLEPGTWRYLTAAELKKLKQLTRLSGAR